MVPPGTFTINKTEIRTYMGVSRVVNVLVEDMNTTFATLRLSVIYDKTSGMALEFEQWWTEHATGIQRAIDYSVSDTNIFEVPRSSAQIPAVAFYALGAVAIAVPVTTAVAFKKRKPETTNKALEQKVIDLTYNLSGVNRANATWPTRSRTASKSCLTCTIAE